MGEKLEATGSGGGGVDVRDPSTSRERQTDKVFRLPESPLLAPGRSGLAETKLHPPSVRRKGLVPRTELVARLQASRAVPLLSVVAPTGYGKTTLLAQWAAKDRRPFAWVTLDEDDNDPMVLLTSIAAALDRVGPIDPTVFDILASIRVVKIPAAIRRLLEALNSMSRPTVLVLDNVNALHNLHCVKAIEMLSTNVPARMQVTLAGRSWPGRSFARMRSDGSVLEVGPKDLTMNDRETGLLLKGMGLDVTKPTVAALTLATEGWPVGVYLAALSWGEGVDDALVAAKFSGDDQFMMEYFWSEFLSQRSPEDVRFLEETAVLDRMSGPLCDAVLGRVGSAEVLRSFESANLLLSPLDRRREWFRYHGLFREALLNRLQHRDPDLVLELRRRASDWCHGNDLLEESVGYAIAAGDAERVARRLSDIASPMWAAGRAVVVERWFDWLDAHGSPDAYPPAAIQWAWIRALTGHPADAERWGDAAERAFEETLPDGSPSIASWLALLRSLLCRDGIDQMASDARIALEGLSNGSQLRATALLLLGISHRLSGDAEAADASMEDAAELGDRYGAAPTVSVALAERSVLAMERGDWTVARTYAQEARRVVEDGGLQDYMTSILAYATAARVGLHEGNVSHAKRDLARAHRLRPLTSRAAPHLAIQSRLELARAHLTLADPGGARLLLREVGDLLRRRPALGVLAKEAEDLRIQLGAINGGTPGASTLTTAELKLLPFLPTYFSFRQIGEQTHLSPHTVKTQAISVYRKLGVTSRGEAIERAIALGLLDA
jgi:LuxR family transcriptional regulator, maltose regulon positive regulatory protein